MSTNIIQVNVFSVISKRWLAIIISVHLHVHLYLEHWFFVISVMYRLISLDLNLPHHKKVLFVIHEDIGIGWYDLKIVNCEDFF